MIAPIASESRVSERYSGVMKAKSVEFGILPSAKACKIFESTIIQVIHPDHQCLWSTMG